MREAEDSGGFDVREIRDGLSMGQADAPGEAMDTQSSQRPSWDGLPHWRHRYNNA
jgi:hypothetical protein